MEAGIAAAAWKQRQRQWQQRPGSSPGAESASVHVEARPKHPIHCRQQPSEANGGHSQWRLLSTHPRPPTHAPPASTPHMPVHPLHAPSCGPNTPAAIFPPPSSGPPHPDAASAPASATASLPPLHRRMSRRPMSRQAGIGRHAGGHRWGSRRASRQARRRHSRGM